MTVLVIGHRGASAYYPENTILAIKKAVEMGADVVEIDVRLSKDLYPIVIHDETLDRTTDGKGPVASYTLAQLQLFDAGDGERIPTLDSVLKYFTHISKLLFIEIKEVKAADKALDLVLKYGMLNKVYFISFYPEALKIISEYEKGANLGLLYASPGKWIDLAFKLHCKAILPKYTITSHKSIRYAHNKGLKVFTWTIDDPRKAVIYAEMGVDGIGTNKPDLILKALSDKGFR